MISLKPAAHQQYIEQVGTVRYLAHKDIKAPWIPLTGALLNPAAYPKLFAIYGYSEGRGVGDQADYFKLPTINGAAAGNGFTKRNPVYLRAHNTKNANGRNLNKLVRAAAPATMKPHAHAGGTNAAGAHTHTVSGSWLSNNGWHGVYSYDGSAQDSFNEVSFPYAHSSHSHSAGSTGAASYPAANTGDTVEPKGYSVVACIYGG